MAKIVYPNTYSKNSTITFGKYKGKTVSEVGKLDPKYLLWADKTLKFFKLTDEYKKFLIDQ